MPVIALSSHANPRDIEKGLSAGFTEYVTKHDPKALIGAMSRVFAGEERIASREIAA
jgi:two-component system chemotaxis sensor kinase CheA